MLDFPGGRVHRRRFGRLLTCAGEQGSEGLMIEVGLRAAAYELVREGVAAKGRKSGVYTVLMPKNLAAKLDAARVPGEDLSDVILRLGRRRRHQRNPVPCARRFRRRAAGAAARFRGPSVIGRAHNERHLSGS